MRFSVLIATHNRAHLVGEAIDSVLAQSRPADEIVVVDDGSTDGTRDRLAAYGERIRAVHQANTGIAGARNSCLGHATGDWITFLDDDDMWYPNRLEILERDVRGAAPDIEVHLANLRYVGRDYVYDEMEIYGLDAPRGRARRVDDIFEHAARGLQLNSLACRRALALEIGFDENLHTHEDTLFCGLLGHGRPWLVTADLVSDVRRLQPDGTSLTEVSASNRERRLRVMLRVYDRLLALDVTGAKRRWLLSYRHFLLVKLARALTTEGRRGEARAALLEAARCHPSAAKGWARCLPPLLFGKPGFDLVLAHVRAFDR
jgi:glycosyltransferase involved in cell wall biosynthesis